VQFELPGGEAIMHRDGERLVQAGLTSDRLIARACKILAPSRAESRLGWAF